MVALFQKNKTILLEGVEVDTKFSELHTFTGQVSGFAREDGTFAADHIILNPPTVDIVCSVGNLRTREESGFGLGIAGQGSIAVGLDGQILAGGLNVAGVNANAGAVYDRSGRAKTAIDELLELHNSRGLFDLVTEHRLYTEMAFLGLTWGNEAPFAGRAELRAHFEQFPSAIVEIVAVPPSDLSSTGGGRTDKTASQEVDAGRQDATTDETAPPRSLAAQLLNFSETTYATSNPA